MTKEEYLLYQERIIEFLNLIRERISPNTLTGIEHYLDHAEIEMAFELFCLEIISKNISFPQNKKRQLLDLAERLGLKSNSVYEPDLWEKLVVYTSEP